MWDRMIIVELTLNQVIRKGWFIDDIWTKIGQMREPAVIFWHNNKYVFWPLSPAPGQTSWDLCNCLINKVSRTVFCSNILPLMPFLTQNSKSLAIFWIIEACFVPRGNCSWTSGWLQKTTLWLQAWNFQPHPSSSGKERGIGDINNRPCLSDEASIKIL